MMSTQKNIKTILVSGMLLMFALAYSAAAQTGTPPSPDRVLWVPFAPGCEVTVADDLPGVSMAFAWTGAEYEKVDILQPGYGYFLIPENPDVDLQLPDCRLDLISAQSVTITLRAGWNLLGNPLRDAMTFNDVADAWGARAQAFAARAVARSARSVISQGGQAQPGEVVWVYALQQGERTLADVVDAAGIKKIQLIPARAHGDTSNVFYIPGAVSFSVSVSYDDGRSETIDPARVQWSVSDENLGRFDAPGVLTSVAPGVVKVTAALVNGMSASADVQLVVECEKVCISAVVAQDKYASVEAYEQFAENLRTQHMGIMPAPQSDCAYMEVSGKSDIKPVKLATVSLVEGVTGANPNVRAYCRQNFDSGAAAHVLFEADPLGGADRNVWLKDITALAEWTWDKEAVITGVSQAGIIQAGQFGFANLTASYKGMQATPAFVGVDKDKPEKIQAFQKQEDAVDSARVPEPWVNLRCGFLPAGTCRDPENQYTRLNVLPFGKSAPLFARVTYGSGRIDKEPQGITWSVEPEGVVSLSEHGTITAVGVGRAAVRAHIGDIVSEPLDIITGKERAVRFSIYAKIYLGNATQPKSIGYVYGSKTLTVHDITKLTFEIITSTNWERNLRLPLDAVKWRVTDAQGKTTNGLDFSGSAPFDVIATYGGRTVPFKVAEQKPKPAIKVFTKSDFESGNGTISSPEARYASLVPLTPQDGVIHISQPEFLTIAMLGQTSYGHIEDYTAETQWNVTGPDGKTTTTQGMPVLEALGLHTVTATYEGETQSVTIDVFDSSYIVLTKKWDSNGDRDTKFKSGEKFSLTVDECLLPDWSTRGRKPATPANKYTKRYFKKCVYLNDGDIDLRLDIETTDPAVLIYDGVGVVRTGRAGIASVRARRGNKVSNHLQVEVWEEVDSFPTCGGVANQNVWYDTSNFLSLQTPSRAIIQTNCSTYKRGEEVKVRWFGQIAPGVPKSSVNVCLDFYIKDCKGRVVKSFRKQDCSRFARRAASDFSDYATVFDTVEEWDQTDDKGNPVAPGCYKASSVFAILYDPILEVEFTIE